MFSLLTMAEIEFDMLLKPELLLWISAFVALIVFFCMWFYYKNLRRYRLMRDTPTSKCQGVFIGFVELKGTAESTSPLTSYLGEDECVLYNWSVEERWSRLVTETYTDSKGHTRTRTRRESGWITVAQGGDMHTFYLKDSTGEVLICPEKARLKLTRTFAITCTPSNDLYYGKGPDCVIADSDHVRRFVEDAIPLHHPLYILGQAMERRSVVAPKIAYDPKAPDFLISTDSEESVASGLKWTLFFLYFLPALLIFGGYGYIFFEEPDTWPFLAIMGSGFILVSLTIWAITMLNNLIGVHNCVKQALSLIDVQYKRRYDLIPNLVSTVQSLRDYERNTQEIMASIRANVTPQANCKSVLPEIRALAEAYPELMSDDAFLFLQKALTDAEDRIALATCYYNDVVTNYNTLVESFPECFAAMICRYRQAPLHHVGDIKRQPVHIDFAQ